MIRVALCDGDRGERERICAMLDQYQLSIEVTGYDAVEALLWDVETDGARFDLYFLPGKDRKAVQKLWTIDREAPVIFLSEGEVPCGKRTEERALGCLRRPVEGKSLRALLEKAAERLRRDRRRVVVITQRNRTHILRFEDIEYISSANHLLRFYLKNGEEQTCYGRLDQTAAQLDPETFVRCHQSHVVNLRWVTGHTSKTFHMSSGAVIPVSRSYSTAARRALEEYLFHISAVPLRGT